MKVIVVGAGIYGLSTAAQLVCSGHEVEVFDRSTIPNVLASSYDYHRLIRHAYGPQTGYSRLIPQALDAWQRLWKLLGESFYVETGALALGPKHDPWITRSRSTLFQMGVDAEDWSVDEACKRIPWLRVGANEDLLYCKSGGILQSGLILEALGHYLRKNAVVLRENIDVATVGHASITDEAGYRYTADHVVCALGAGHGFVFSGEIQPYRQVYGLYDNVSSTASVDGRCPMILDIGDKAGFYYVPGSKHFPAKVGDHISRFVGHPYEPRSIHPEEIESLQGVINSRICGPLGFLEGADEYSLESQINPSRYGLCFYESTSDHTIQLQSSGACTRIFGGSGHGFKFGALFGETVADYLCGDRSFESAQKVVQGLGLP